MNTAQVGLTKSWEGLMGRDVGSLLPSTAFNPNDLGQDLKFFEVFFWGVP